MKRTSILAAGLFTATLAAHAGEMPQLSSYDADGDGQISQAEFVDAKVATGKVTEEEATAKFAEADTDADGYLTEAEFTVAAEAWKAAKESGQ